MNLSRFSVLAVFFMMVMSAFVAVPMYNVGADEHEGDGPYLNAFPTGGSGDPSDYEMSVDVNEGGANVTVEATELIDGTSYKIEWEIFDIVEDLIGATGYWDFSGGSSSASVEYFIGQELFDSLGTGCYMFTGWLIDLDAGVEIEEENWPFTLDLPFSACDEEGPDGGDCPFDDREGSPCEDVDTNPCREDHESDECWSYVESYCEDNDDPGCFFGDPSSFVCGNGDVIPFVWVNDGEEDCEDGSDEQQYDDFGDRINWFDCHDGSEVWIEQVNNGVDDCYDGEDEGYGGDDYDDDGPQPEAFHATMTMDSLEDWTVDYFAEMSIDDSDEMREGLAGMCVNLGGENDGEWITEECFNYWLEMMNSGDGGDDGGDGMGCPPGLTELQCDNLMSCMDENGDIICSMLEFQRNLYNICNDDDSHEFCYYSDEDGRDMFNVAFAYEDGDLSAEDFMELIIDSIFGDDTGMGGEGMFVIYDNELITIGAEDEGEYVIETDGECYEVEEDEWECFYPHYVMLMDGNDDIVAIKQEYCDWDSDNIENVECDSEIRVDLSEGTYNLVTATGCYSEWNETTEEMGDLICDSTGKYNYTMYWAEDMTENWNILGSIDDDSTVNEFDYMDYFELQEDYGFAPVYETYEFNVGPDGFQGDIFSYQYSWENDCEDDCEYGRNMILWMYEYSFNPDNTVDNLMAVSGHNDYDEDDEYYCCYSMLDLELTEGTYVFVMSGDYTHMISDDWSTLYHDTVISEYDDEGGANDLEWYGALDSNDSRAYFPSNYYEYEDRGDDNPDDDGWLFMAMIENVTAYQDEDITAEEAANNFIDLMYIADAMGIYDDISDDPTGMYWESWNYCEWEGDDWEGNTMWYCTDNANGNDGFDDWWYYCEMHDDGVGGSNYYCTDDFGQSPDYEFSASNDHYVTGGSPDGSGGGENDCPFDSNDFCYEIGPYCDSESGDYDPAYCGAESAHYCLEDGVNDEGCANIDDIAADCDAGEAPQEICDAFLNFDHDAYHDGDDEDDHARLDGIIGTENPPNNIPVISSTNIVGALSDNEGLPMMYTGSFKLNFEGVDASLETHEAYIPVDDGTWHVEMILLEGYDVKSCEGCENLVIEGSNAKFDADEPVTVIFGKVADTTDCDAIVTVGADGYSFEPAEITIAAGDTVCWIWDTTDVHNVAEIVTKFDADMNLEDAKIGFNSGEPANRVDFRHTFEENDKTHYYVCEPHATMGMVGTVTVGDGTAEDPIQEIADESGLPSIGFVVGALALVGAAGLRRRIR